VRSHLPRVVRRVNTQNSPLPLSVSGCSRLDTDLARVVVVTRRCRDRARRRDRVSKPLVVVVVAATSFSTARARVSSASLLSGIQKIFSLAGETTRRRSSPPFIPRDGVGASL